MGGPENGNFPLLYVVKMSLRRWVGEAKKPQNTLLDHFGIATCTVDLISAQEGNECTTREPSQITFAFKGG